MKYEVLSLGCGKGDLECVKMMTNKYDCDLKGLPYTISVATTYLYDPCCDMQESVKHGYILQSNVFIDIFICDYQT